MFCCCDDQVPIVVIVMQVPIVVIVIQVPIVVIVMQVPIVVVMVTCRLLLSRHSRGNCCCDGQVPIPTRGRRMKITMATSSTIPTTTKRPRNRRLKKSNYPGM